MAIVCQTCGTLGYAHRLVYCKLCRKIAQHEYCMDIIRKSDEEDINWSDVRKSDEEDINWSCEGCNIGSVKLPVGNSQGNEDTTDQCFEWSKHTGRRRKLVLSSEDDLIDEKESLLENEIDVLEKTICLDQSFENARPYDQRTLTLSDEEDNEWCKPTNRRRRLVLFDEDDDSIDDIEKESLFETEMNILEKTIFSYQSFEKAKPNDQRRLTLSDEEDKHNDLEASSLKETIVCLKYGEMKDLESGSVLPKMDDEVTAKTKGCDYSMKRSSENFTGADEQLQNLASVQDNRDSAVPQSEIYYISSMPIRSRSWRGWFKICGKAYGPLTAHLSTKAGEKAWNATKSLPQIIPLTMVSRSRAWPRSFEVSPPTDDHIALFFFPPDSRVEMKVDQLLEEVIRCDLALKVVLDEAEMLIFPSILLPENYKRFQYKYYLWGVFKRKDSDSDTNAEKIIEIQPTNEISTKQTVPELSTGSQEDSDKNAEKIIGIQPTNETSKEQTVHEFSIGSQEMQIERESEHELTQEKLNTDEEERLLSKGEEEQTVHELSTGSQEMQIERENEHELTTQERLDTGEEERLSKGDEKQDGSSHLTDELTQDKMDTGEEEILLSKGEEKQDGSSHDEEGDDEEMAEACANEEEELNGLLELELFPMQVENMALFKLKLGEGNKGIDLELSLGGNFRR